MELKELVENYMDFWNRRDTTGLLSFMHKGAAYYDAFWRETCVGSDLERYLGDSLAEERYSYKVVDTIIAAENAAILRYAAYAIGDAEESEATFNGAEVLVVRGGKILTVSDYYCQPTQDALIEVARLAEMRHGESSYAMSGYGASKYLQIKREFSRLIDEEKLYLNPNLSASQLADQIGVPTEHLLKGISVTSDAAFVEMLSWPRTEFAKELLMEESGDATDFQIVASQSGFTSVAALNDAFVNNVGESPEVFSARHN